MSSDHAANHGDTVIAVTTSWQGHEVFTGKRQVDKTYKNGNVVLKGIKGQFYHIPTSDGYKLSQCSGSMQLVKLTDEVQARIKKSVSIQELFSAYHQFEKSFMRNRRFVNQLSVDEISSIKESLSNAIILINKDDSNDK